MTTSEDSRPAVRVPVALVTGANRGLGLAIVAGLLRESFAVYLGARDPGRGATAAAGLRELGDVRFLELDVTSQESVDAAVARVDADFCYLDVLVNNAGVSTGTFRRLDGTPPPSEQMPEDLRSVYQTNVFAVVRMTNAILPLLRRSPTARIVNMTSKRGSIGEDGVWMGQPDMAYSSSKTALNAVTVHYARELAGSGIKVNGAAPGHVATDFNGFRGTRTPDQGSAVAIRLATLPVDGPQVSSSKTTSNSRETYRTILLRSIVL